MMQKKHTDLPESLELEQWKRRVERSSSWKTAVCFVVGVGGLILGYIEMGRDIALVVVDQEGRPTLYKSSEAAKWQTDDLRIEYFAKEFTKKWEGVNSARIDEDLTDAMGMMSPQLRRHLDKDENTYKVRDAFRHSHVRTLFSDLKSEISPYKADGHKAIAVWVAGRKTYTSEYGGTAKVDEHDEWFYIQLKLNPVKVSKTNIHGLEVGWLTVKVAESQEALEAVLQERGA